MQVAAPAIASNMILKGKNRQLQLLEQLPILFAEFDSIVSLLARLKGVFKSVLMCEKVNIFTVDFKSQVRDVFEFLDAKMQLRCSSSSNAAVRQVELRTAGGCY